MLRSYTDWCVMSSKWGLPFIDAFDNVPADAFLRSSNSLHSILHAGRQRPVCLDSMTRAPIPSFVMPLDDR